MNKHGMASPTTMLTLLEETAAEHCHDIGFCLYNLENRNIGWVLLSGVIDMVRYPKYKENITIRTWLSKYTLVKGYRENIIFDNENNIIGRARGIWAFYDTRRRRPVPIFDDIRRNWGISQEISIESNTDLLKQTDNGLFATEFDVCYSDVDNNKHVNNIRYFHYLLESLQEEFCDNNYLKTINAQFISEAKFGEKIQVYINNNVGELKYFHTMKSSANGKLLAMAHTQWANMKKGLCVA
jgi:acyl-ACP thioesterase